MKLAEYGPPNEDGVCEPIYRLRKRGEKPTIEDLIKDGVTFPAQVEGQPPKVVYIPGCVFEPYKPPQRHLYPGE